MEHIGIDLGSRDSQVCTRNGAGQIVEEVRCRTAHLERLLASLNCSGNWLLRLDSNQQPSG